jgi:pimeloyl-ACP methyl ester carboxylesterase
MTGDRRSADVDLYYEIRGQGVPILLVPASGSTAATWGPAGDELAGIGQVIAYDRRGYLRSGGPPGRSIAEHTADAVALLDRLQVAPAVVVGISVAATIALDLARLRPDLVRAVVAHESPWHVTRHPPTPHQVRALSGMSWLAARGRHADAAETFLRFAYGYRDGGSAWDSFPDQWRDAARENAEAALADIRVAVGGYPSAKLLAGINSRVLCSCGDRSRDTMHRVTRSLARRVPGATVELVKDAGHAAAFDAPGNFVALVRDAIGASAVTR